MSDKTKIEWADATVNAVNGCSVVSPGCTNCYAMRLAGGRMKNHSTRAGLTQPGKSGPVWTGEVRLNEKALTDPLRWVHPRHIFWNAHGDLFHENVPDAWIDKVLAVCALTPQHTHMVLTKRSARMRDYLLSRNGMGNADLCQAINAIPAGIGNRHGALEMPLPNLWLGVSVEDQTRAVERIPDLLAIPAAIRFISAEPLLGPIYLTPALIGPDALDWVICGGESGPGCRDNDFETNARDLLGQCRHAGVAFFGKQNVGKRPLPADLQIRELPR
jgi:protein gp37